jgi:putative ABC transport system permease protein
MRRMFDRFLLRLRSLTTGERLDATLRSEIQTHLDEQIAEHVRAGMSPAEARAAALRDFGPMSQIEEECRDVRRVTFLTNLAQDLRYTGRALRRQPLLVCAATMSIAIAVSANATVFNLANELLLENPSASHPDQLVNLNFTTGSHVSYAQWRDLNESGALAGVAGYYFESEVNVKDGDQSLSLMPLIVTPNYFDLLGVPVALGRGFGTTEAQPDRQAGVVVISHRCWERRFQSDPQILGRSMIVNGQPYTVIGVLPSNLRAVPGLGTAPELYLPLSRSLMPDLDNPNAAAAQLVGRLREGQSVDQGRAALNAAAERLQPRHPARKFGTVERIVPVGGLAQLTHSREIGVFFAVLLIAVGLVLAIACANVAGLLLARSTVRRREIAIRVALGASRWRLVQQLLTEGLWIALVGTAIGVLLMFVWMRLVASIPLPLPIPLELRATLDGNVLMYSALLLVVTTILCGLAPALQATRPSLVPGLKQEEPQYAHRRWTLRSLLVIGQVAVALVLLATALLFTRNLVLARDADTGFDTAHTLVVRLGFVEGRHTPETRTIFFEEAVDRLRRTPGVERAAYSYGVPLTIRSGMTTGALLRVAGGESFQARYQANFVGPDYFSSIGIPLRQGREFLASDKPGATKVAIVNEEFARRHLRGTIVGQTLILPGLDAGYPVEIVGVVADSKYRTIGEDQQPAVYESLLQRGSRGRVFHLIVRARDTVAPPIREVRELLSQMDPSAAVDVQTMRSTLAFAFLPSQVGASLLGALGALGLALAMAGLYAVVSYSVTRRTAEIGIRVALGASPHAVIRLMLRDAAILAGAGIVVGSGIAIFVTKPLAMFLVSGLKANDPLTFCGTAVMLGLVSLAAAWLPARRALAVDPVIALRDQ